MKIILTLLCRNEADIIASTVDFHLRHGVDFIVATDNGSTDGTVEILEAYQRQGILHLLHEPMHNHDQAVWVTRMAQLAAQQYRAEWVIHCDADEFWWPKDGCIKNVLSQVHADQIAVAIDRFNFLPPIHDAHAKLPFYQTQIFREQISLNSLGNPLPPKVCHRADSSISVTDGNHSVLVAGQPHNIDSTFNGIEIFHFPVRSYQQFKRKIRDGAEALARNSRIEPHVGITWKKIYNEYLMPGKLEHYYASLKPTPSELQGALAEGKIVEDRRLQIDFTGLSH